MVTIVFDGYPDVKAKSTKTTNWVHRQNKAPTAIVVVTEVLISTMLKERFISIEKNKERLLAC